MGLSRSIRRSISVSIAAALFAACIGINAAAEIVPAASISVQIGNNTPWVGMPNGTSNGNGTFAYRGNWTNDAWALGMAMTGDPDPFISSVIAFTNNSAATQTYTITVTLPTIAIPGGTLIGGSVGGSVTDSNNDGTAVVTAGSGPGTFLYSGLMDGVTAPGATLYPFPASFAAPFAGGTADIPAISFGLPGPTFPGPALVGSIGITLHFTLTAGDSVGITSFFQVEPIPAPGVLALLGLAGLASSRRRRRN